MSKASRKSTSNGNMSPPRSRIQSNIDSVLFHYDPVPSPTTWRSSAFMGPLHPSHDEGGEAASATLRSRNRGTAHDQPKGNQSMALKEARKIALALKKRMEDEDAMAARSRGALDYQDDGGERPTSRHGLQGRREVDPHNATALTSGQGESFVESSWHSPQNIPHQMSFRSGRSSPGRIHQEQSQLSPKKHPVPRSSRPVPGPIPRSPSPSNPEHVYRRSPSFDVGGQRSSSPRSAHRGQNKESPKSDNRRRSKQYSSLHDLAPGSPTRSSRRTPDEYDLNPRQSSRRTTSSIPSFVPAPATSIYRTVSPRKLPRDRSASRESRASQKPKPPKGAGAPVYRRASNESDKASSHRPRSADSRSSARGRTNSAASSRTSSRSRSSRKQASMPKPNSTLLIKPVPVQPKGFIRFQDYLAIPRSSGGWVPRAH